jgi:hypothetical protein
LHLFIAPEIENEKDNINKLKITNHIKIHYMTSDGTEINLQRTDLNWNQIYTKIKNKEN